LYKISANTLFTGQHLVFVPECHSTNSLTSEMALQTNLPEGTVVITSNQTAGRGQRGNTWDTLPGMNLTFSILLKPTFLPIRNQFYLTIVTSLAVVDFLNTQAVSHAKIKWPNDVLVNKRKISGILIENSIQRVSLQQSIVGIGLNINQIDFAQSSATSLLQVAHKTYVLNEALNSLLEKFEKRYLQLREGKWGELKKEYMDNLFGLREQRSFISNNKEFDGTIEEVSERGELVVLKDSKKIAFGMKEIQFVI
jgi:BirA family transcriptional regulator, biotin operon repressor / biotin---[acetyl-CoA-carboxylase] ligase